MAKGSALRKNPSDAASAEFAALLDESLGGSASFEGTVVKGTIVRSSWLRIASGWLSLLPKARRPATGMSSASDSTNTPRQARRRSWDHAGGFRRFLH